MKQIDQKVVRFGDLIRIESPTMEIVGIVVAYLGKRALQLQQANGTTIAVKFDSLCTIDILERLDVAKLPAISFCQLLCLTTSALGDETTFIIKNPYYATQWQ